MMTRRPATEWIGFILALTFLALGIVVASYGIMAMVSWVVSLRWPS